MENKALIVDIDEYKAFIPGYKPAKASEVQSQSAKLANKAFEKAIKSRKYKKVVLMCGGSASGKTEFVRSHLYARNCIIFDSTLSMIKGAEIKIKKILKEKLDFEIWLIIPDDLKRAYVAFRDRERKIIDSVFTKTHIGSRATVLHFAKKGYYDKINLLESVLVGDILTYWKFKFISKGKLIEHLEEIQLKRPTLRKIIREYEEKAN